MWLDKVFYGGWRIQKNILTGHHRLLSARDFRKAWGSFEACKKVLEKQIHSGKIKNPNPHLILLVHGMAGFPQTFFILERHLRREGYFVDGYNFPSLAGTLENQADDFNFFLGHLEGIRELTLIGHSQGGAVIRKALETTASWQKKIKLNGVVMIGTPNQGAALADYTKRLKALGKFAPKVRDQLTTEYSKTLGVPKGRVGLIAGSFLGGKGINPVVKGDDDGVVGVEEVWIDGVKDRLVVRSDHFSLANRKATRQAILRFLEGRPLAG